jgi:hypothetical protein
MEYLSCTASEPFEEPPTIQTRSESPPPPFLESSSDQSEFSEKESNNTATFTGILNLKAGEISPSAVCGQRKLSTAIATTSEFSHPTLAGRQTMVMPNLNSTTPLKKILPRPPPRSAPPKAPRTGPPRPQHNTLERSTSTAESKNQRAVAPLPDLVRGKLHRASSAPAGGWIGEYQVHPSPLRMEAWSEPAAENFSVRGPNYLKDKKKVTSEQSAFRLLTVDLINCDKPLYGGICAHPNERIQQALAREEETGIKELPAFVFCVNLCVPGPSSSFYHKVSYFGIDNMEEIRKETTPFGKLMNKFIFGDDNDFRNSTFKLIPRIVDGNFVVRKAVGSKPSILGKKIKQYYIRGERYLEIIVDIASDAVAQRIVKLALGCTKTMVVDMMYLLEGNEEAMLPERILGGVRMKNIDFKAKDGKRCVIPPE